MRHNLTQDEKTKWIEALRSGKYKQCFGAMYSVSGSEKKQERYCVLGVLVHVLSPASFTTKREKVVWEELPVDLPSSSAPIISMNDNDERTFSELADWIEENIIVDE